jgi:alpha-L-fucosidase
VDATPFKRDVVRELADACRKEGLKLHLYYSLVDWYREDYPMGERTGLDNGKDPAKGDYDHYFEFMKAQLTELLTRYGEIGCIWMDGLWNQKPGFDWRLPELYAHIHSLQPACLIANNHHQAAKEGEDIQCFERDVPGENKAGYISGEIEISRQLPLETCQTMNRTWGYSLTDQNYTSVEEIRALLEAANAKGANLLLNIGPMPSGKLPDKAVDILKALQTK